MLSFLISAIVISGLALIVAGLFESQHEATELKNMSARINRIRTASSRVKRGDEVPEEDKEYAREEEKRLRRERKTTYLPSLSKLAESSATLTRLEEELIQVKSPWRATELVAGSVFGALLVLVALLLLGWKGWALFPAISVLFVPRVYVKAVRAAYYRRFDDQLADALMLMSNSLRAGFSFMQSVEMVAREAPAPLGDEFARMTKEIAVGVPIADAMGAMAARLNSVDLNLVVTAVTIQREVGGALAELLELIAEVIRERQRIKGEIRTLTAQGRLTGMILGFMPFTVGGLLFFVSRAVAPDQPSFIQPLISELPGQMLLAGAVVWQMIGFWIIMRIVSIKV